ERTFERDVRGKPAVYATCLVRNKEVQLKPEERTRQLWLARLTEQFGYPASRIQVEYPITFGRDSSKRADIVVFDADRPTVPYIIMALFADRIDAHVPMAAARQYLGVGSG
ncbi:type I restriction enzyme HsdR N-terminal domain-containing protein, partial [Hoeflea sp.]|uniref:type I restriction enzyme HsdR N-terminal domain-containing protein n=1 Tax=Hoeflea sp. TaxID=1940281 RepID=UPI0019C2B824